MLDSYLVCLLFLYLCARDINIYLLLKWCWLILSYSIQYSHNIIMRFRVVNLPTLRVLSVDTKTSFWRLAALLGLFCVVFAPRKPSLCNWCMDSPPPPPLIITVWSCDPCPQLPIGCTAVLSFSLGPIVKLKGSVTGRFLFMRRTLWTPR